jgi:hypothetical protein
MRAIALYKCVGEDEAELSFAVGDVIYKVERTQDSGWYRGELNGITGSFPGNFVRFEEEPVAFISGIPPNLSLPLEVFHDPPTDIRQYLANKSKEIVESKLKSNAIPSHTMHDDTPQTSLNINLKTQKPPIPSKPNFILTNPQQHSSHDEMFNQNSQLAIPKYQNESISMLPKTPAPKMPNLALHEGQVLAKKPPPPPVSSKPAAYVLSNAQKSANFALQEGQDLAKKPPPPPVSSKPAAFVIHNAQKSDNMTSKNNIPTPPLATRPAGSSIQEFNSDSLVPPPLPPRKIARDPLPSGISCSVPKLQPETPCPISPDALSRYGDLFQRQDIFERGALDASIVRNVWLKSGLDNYTLGLIWYGILT